MAKKNPKPSDTEAFRCLTAGQDKGGNILKIVIDKGGFMPFILCQPHGGRLRPVAYFSFKLDPITAGFPHCLRAVATEVPSHENVGYADVMLMVSHAQSHILHA